MATGTNLRKGRTRSCGCGEHAIRKDLTGRVFGRWTVLGIAEGHEKGRPAWRVRCKCGAVATCRSDQLTSGHSKSCGCWNVDSHTTHGLLGTPEYKCWQAIKERCLNPRATGYAMYGGRGVCVCERWRESFEAFYADMGQRPSDDHSIDRVDTFGNYEADNCRWATRAEQQRNRRSTMHLFFRGETKPLADWCDITGLPRNVVHGRIKYRKWSVERALTEPVRKRKPNRHTSTARS